MKKIIIIFSLLFILTSCWCKTDQCLIDSEKEDTLQKQIQLEEDKMIIKDMWEYYLWCSTVVCYKWNWNYSKCVTNCINALKNKTIIN